MSLLDFALNPIEAYFVLRIEEGGVRSRSERDEEFEIGFEKKGNKKNKKEEDADERKRRKKKVDTGVIFYKSWVYV